MSQSSVITSDTWLSFGSGLGFCLRAGAGSNWYMLTFHHRHLVSQLKHLCYEDRSQVLWVNAMCL